MSCRNILTLLNTFDLPEGNISQSNYQDVFHSLNSTSPDIISNLNLKTCDLNSFLSEVQYMNGRFRLFIPIQALTRPAYIGVNIYVSNKWNVVLSGDKMCKYSHLSLKCSNSTLTLNIIYKIYMFCLLLLLLIIIIVQTTSSVRLN